MGIHLLGSLHKFIAFLTRTTIFHLLSLMHTSCLKNETRTNWNWSELDLLTRNSATITIICGIMSHARHSVLSKLAYWITMQVHIFNPKKHIRGHFTYTTANMTIIYASIWKKIQSSVSIWWKIQVEYIHVTCCFCIF